MCAYCQTNTSSNVASILARAVHDIRSPISCLLMMTKDVNLKEEHQQIVKIATSRMQAIINQVDNVICTTSPIITESNEAFVFSPIIEEILVEKRYKYSNLNALFEYKSDKNIDNYLIEGNANSFQRLLSNLIDNGVDACENNIRITIKTIVSRSSVKLIIRDNGKGMPKNVQDKILKNIPVTYGKANGHGIGYGQIHETLTLLKGKLSIKSKEGVGTDVILIFPIKVMH